MQKQYPVKVQKAFRILQLQRFFMLTQLGGIYSQGVGWRPF